MDDVTQALIDALALIDREGWTQGQLHHPRFGYCPRGAVNMAANGDPRVPCTEAHRALQAALPDGYRDWAVQWWNDLHERTYADVRGLFVRAIAARAATMGRTLVAA